MSEIINPVLATGEGIQTSSDIISKYAQMGQAMSIIPNAAVSTTAVGFVAYKMNKELLSLYGRTENKELLLVASTIFSSGLFFIVKNTIDNLIRKNPPLAMITSIFSVAMVTNLVFKIQGSILEMILKEGKWTSTNIMAALYNSVQGFDFRGYVENSISSALGKVTA